jgi:hypothetical protein
LSVNFVKPLAALSESEVIVRNAVCLVISVARS